MLTVISLGVRRDYSTSFNVESRDYTVYTEYIQNVLGIALIFTLEVNVVCKAWSILEVFKAESQVHRIMLLICALNDKKYIFNFMPLYTKK